jgi:bisphosphoglycerate-dependent phosphoglycerate mutase
VVPVVACTLGQLRRLPRAGLARRFDTAEVRESAREFEEQVVQVVAADRRLQQLVEQLEQAADEDRIEDADLPSGDELVAELERFLRERQDPPPPQGV